MSLFETFQAAVDELRSRIAVSDDEYESLVDAARERAFSVAGLAQQRLVEQVLDTLAKAVERGQGLDEWRRQLGEDLKQAWGKGSAFRLETIFRNAVQTAYNRGRYQQMTHPTIMRMRPYWMYDAVLDKRTTPICRERDRTVKEATDQWWNSNYPPLHHRCRSAVRTLTRRQGEGRGVTDTSEVESSPQSGFGAAPTQGLI